jgi:uncharacterized protein YkwD
MKTRFASTFTILLAAGLLLGCNTKTTSPSQTEQPLESASAAATATRPAATATQVPVPGLSVENPTATPAGEPTLEPATPVASEPNEPASTVDATAIPTAGEEAVATTPTEAPQAEAEAACTDVAAFLNDVTVEDYTMFRQKESFVKTWRVRNAGTCTWRAGYTIDFDSGFTFDAPQSSPLPEAEPGQAVEISLQMAAPERGGEYISRWRFKNPSGAVFGIGPESGQLYTIINVGFIGPTSQPTEPPGEQQPSAPSVGGVQNTPEPVSGGDACPYSVDQGFAQQLVAMINEARRQTGLNALSEQHQLVTAAQVHSIDIACTDSYDHIGSDGSVWTERVARQGYANYNSARENIRVGNPDFGFSPQYVFDRWFESQIHHDNMYFPSASEIGLSCVLNPDSEYKEFCTAVFARP